MSDINLDFEKEFDKVLTEYQIYAVDNLMSEFYQEIVAVRQGDTLSNDRIRYYMHHFSYHMYRLRTIKARENLKAALAAQAYEAEYNSALLSVEAPQGKKYIKEEKIALATKRAQEEQRVSILYKGISNAIDERIQGLDKLLYNLSTSANLNMSEARLASRGGDIN